MKVFIVAHEIDNHTVPVKWALEQAGYEVVCWPGLGWSPRLQASIFFSSEAQMILGSCPVEPNDVVWIRRPEPPQPNPKVSEEDTKFAKGEYRWFSDSLLYALEMLPIRCVNRYTASRFIRNKSVQLALAIRCGLNVPRTCMTNSPDEVRRFLGSGGARAICKPFFPHIWQKHDGGSMAVTETFEINAETLPADEVLTFAPAIYQERVMKEFDVRMVLLGGTVYSCALRNAKGSIDWRQDATQGHVQVEKIETPPEVLRAVLAFAEKSGIAYGSFDFAVDADRKWWFLEVNEGGQFLWLDALNPEIHIQEKFLSFLTLPEGASRELIESRISIFPSWQDFLSGPANQPPIPGPLKEAPDFVSLER